MATISLRIIKPRDDQAFAGNPPPAVEFQGELAAPPPGVALYFRWYSSLNEQADPDQGRYSLHATALAMAGTAYTERLALGSHVIAFAASDHAGETAADFRAIRHGAATGGDQGPGRCVIHVFSARIVGLPATAPRSDLVLKAEAPWAWGSDAYHQYNQLAYRWVLTPSGQVGGRPTLSFRPSRTDLRFEPATTNSPPLATYAPALPAHATGAYEITLFVEDRRNPVAGRQAMTTGQVELLA